MNDSALQHVAPPTWQCAMVCWGTKYPVSLINNLVQKISDHSANQPRFVLITESEKPGLLPCVQTRPFPAFFEQPALRRSGCQAKLALFDEGMLPTDLPTVYIDLDTVVAGDVGRAIELMKNRQSVLMLQSAIIPFGRIGRLIWRLTDHKRYARGNSSLVVFHPAECHFIAQRFRDLFAKHPNFEFRPMVADERFISWAAQPHMERLPKSFAVKFPTEFMFPVQWWLYVRAALPWVRARRNKLTAITLNGLSIKPERLLELKDGELVVDEKGRKLLWSQRTLGRARQTIVDFYKTALPNS